MQVHPKELVVERLKAMSTASTHLQSGSALSRLIQVTVVMSTSSVCDAAVHGPPDSLLQCFSFLFFKFCLLTYSK